MFSIENYQTSKQDSHGRVMQFRDGDVILYKITNQRSGDPNEPKIPDNPDDPDDPYDPDDRNDGLPPDDTPSAQDSYNSNGTH